MRLPRPLLLPACIAVIIGCLALPAAGIAASARVSAVSCDAGGAIVELSNDAGAPATFVILRDDTVIDRVVLPAGVPAQRVVPIAEDAAAQVTVRQGASYASSYVRRNCSGAQIQEPAPARDAQAPYPAAPVVPGTGVRDEPAPTAARPDPNADVTIEDARPTWPLLLGGALVLLAAGGVLLVRSRRSATTPQPPPAPAVRRRA